MWMITTKLFILVFSSLVSLQHSAITLELFCVFANKQEYNGFTIRV